VSHKVRQERSPIADEILAYLAEHPDARDTLEGIVQWWLLEQEIKKWAAEVKAALDDLVVEGLVIEERGVDARTHYRLNRPLAEEVGLLPGGTPNQEDDKGRP
jgi:hypothetical protein